MRASPVRADPMGPAGEKLGATPFLHPIKTKPILQRADLPAEKFWGRMDCYVATKETACLWAASCLPLAEYIAAVLILLPGGASSSALMIRALRGTSLRTVTAGRIRDRDFPLKGPIVSVDQGRVEGPRLATQRIRQLIAR